MRKIAKRILIGVAITIHLLCLIFFIFISLIYLSFTNTIPHFADASSSDYLGYQPTSGRVWQHAGGFVDGYEYTRLHFKPSSYGRLELVVLLTHQNMPQAAERAPWWWGAIPDGKTTILIGSGKCADCKYYEIYDPTRELLFTYEEW